MINFTNFDAKPYRYFASEAEVEAARESLERHTQKILNDLTGIKQDHFYLGCHLIDLLKSEDYSSDPGWIVPNRSLSGKIQGCCGSFVFYSYCEKTFGLDKSQVSRYMNIVDEFGDEMRGYKAPWDLYSYSQLVELLPLSEEQRSEVSPSMTVKDIRDYKKKLDAKFKSYDPFTGTYISAPSAVAPLEHEQAVSDKPVATSQQEQKAPDPPVATSQQEVDINSYGGILKFERAFENDVIQFPKVGVFLDLSKYDICRGLTLKQLCDSYIRSSEQASIAGKLLKDLQIKYAELEQKYDELRMSIDITNAGAKK